jgi:hypothetical protein
LPSIGWTQRTADIKEIQARGTRRRIHEIAKSPHFWPAEMQKHAGAASRMSGSFLIRILCPIRRADSALPVKLESVGMVGILPGIEAHEAAGKGRLARQRAPPV